MKAVTLTQGKPEVEKIFGAEGISEIELMAIASGAESKRDGNNTG